MIVMKIKLTQDELGALHADFIGGMNSVSQNNESNNYIEVTPNGFKVNVDDGEILEISYATTLNESDAETDNVGYTMMSYNADRETWSIEVDPIVLARRGVWYLSLRVATYLEGKRVGASKSVENLEFTVNADIYNSNGEYPNKGDVATFYQNALKSEAVAKEAVTAAVTAITEASASAMAATTAKEKAEQAVINAKEAAEGVLKTAVKKTGDTMTGPLIVENSRSLGRSGVIPDGFHVQSGEEAETHYGQGFILRKADTNAYPNGTFEEIVNALPPENGTLATEEYVDDKTDTLSKEIAIANAILEQSGIVSKYKATIEDTYSERITADGANVLDGSKAKLEKVVGSTVACKNLLNISNVSWTSAQPDVSGIKITDISENVITVASGTEYNSDGNVMIGNTLAELCPNLRVGETYYLNADVVGDNVDTIIYLRGAGPWKYGYAKEITQDMLNATVAIRGSKTSGVVTISNLRITKEQNTSWQPYFTGLKSASFGGIESTNADSTETATLDFPKTETPLGTTIDFENKKIVDASKVISFNGTENWTIGVNALGEARMYLNTNLGIRPAVDLNIAADIVCADYETKASNNLNQGKAGIALNTLGHIYVLDKAFSNITDISVWKEYLSQKASDGNPLQIACYAATPTETPFTEEQSASGNEYTAYKGGTEKVLDNDGKEYGAENTLSQNYIIVTEVK